LRRGPCRRHAGAELAQALIWVKVLQLGVATARGVRPGGWLARLHTLAILPAEEVARIAQSGHAGPQVPPVHVLLHLLRAQGITGLRWPLTGGWALAAGRGAGRLRGPCLQAHDVRQERLQISEDALFAILPREERRRAVGVPPSVLRREDVPGQRGQHRLFRTLTRPCRRHSPLPVPRPRSCRRPCSSGKCWGCLRPAGGGHACGQAPGEAPGAATRGARHPELRQCPWAAHRHRALLSDATGVLLATAAGCLCTIEAGGRIVISNRSTTQRTSPFHLTKP
jgi:hypothetical protein